MAQLKVGNFIFDVGDNAADIPAPRFAFSDGVNTGYVSLNTEYYTRIGYDIGFEEGKALSTKNDWQSNQLANLFGGQGINRNWQSTIDLLNLNGVDIPNFSGMFKHANLLSATVYINTKNAINVSNMFYNTYYGTQMTVNFPNANDADYFLYKPTYTENLSLVNCNFQNLVHVNNFAAGSIWGMQSINMFNVKTVVNFCVGSTSAALGARVGLFNIAMPSVTDIDGFFTNQYNIDYTKGCHFNQGTISGQSNNPQMLNFLGNMFVNVNSYTTAVGPAMSGMPQLYTFNFDVGFDPGGYKTIHNFFYNFNYKYTSEFNIRIFRVQNISNFAINSNFYSMNLTLQNIGPMPPVYFDENHWNLYPNSDPYWLDMYDAFIAQGDERYDAYVAVENAVNEWSFGSILSMNNMFNNVWFYQGASNINILYSNIYFDNFMRTPTWTNNQWYLNMNWQGNISGQYMFSTLQLGDSAAAQSNMVFGTIKDSTNVFNYIYNWSVNSMPAWQNTTNEANRFMGFFGAEAVINTNYLFRNVNFRQTSHSQAPIHNLANIMPQWRYGPELKINLIDNCDNLFQNMYINVYCQGVNNSGMHWTFGEVINSSNLVQNLIFACQSAGDYNPKFYIKSSFSDCTDIFNNIRAQPWNAQWQQVYECRLNLYLETSENVTRLMNNVNCSNIDIRATTPEHSNLYDYIHGSNFWYFNYNSTYSWTDYTKNFNINNEDTHRYIYQFMNHINAYPHYGSGYRNINIWAPHFTNVDGLLCNISNRYNYWAQGWQINVNLNFAGQSLNCVNMFHNIHALNFQAYFNLGQPINCHRMFSNIYYLNFSNLTQGIAYTNFNFNRAMDCSYMFENCYYINFGLNSWINFMTNRFIPRDDEHGDIGVNLSHFMTYCNFVGVNTQMAGTSNYGIIKDVQSFTDCSYMFQRTNFQPFTGTFKVDDVVNASYMYEGAHFTNTNATTGFGITIMYVNNGTHIFDNAYITQTNSSLVSFSFSFCNDLSYAMANLRAPLQFFSPIQADQATVHVPRSVNSLAFFFYNTKMPGTLAQLQNFSNVLDGFNFRETVNIAGFFCNVVANCNYDTTRLGLEDAKKLNNSAKMFENVSAGFMIQRLHKTLFFAFNNTWDMSNMFNNCRNIRFNYNDSNSGDMDETLIMFNNLYVGQNMFNYAGMSDNPRLEIQAPQLVEAQNMFRNFIYNGNLNLNASNMCECSNMFQDAVLHVEEMDYRAIVNADNMFRNVRRSINQNDFDLISIQNAAYMFSNAIFRDEVINIQFYTPMSISNIDINHMFETQLATPYKIFMNQLENCSNFNAHFVFNGLTQTNFQDFKLRLSVTDSDLSSMYFQHKRLFNSVAFDDSIIDTMNVSLQFYNTNVSNMFYITTGDKIMYNMLFWNVPNVAGFYGSGQTVTKASNIAWFGTNFNMRLAGIGCIESSNGFNITGNSNVTMYNATNSTYYSTLVTAESKLSHFLMNGNNAAYNSLRVTNSSFYVGAESAAATEIHNVELYDINFNYANINLASHGLVFTGPSQSMVVRESNMFVRSNNPVPRVFFENTTFNNSYFTVGLNTNLSMYSDAFSNVNFSFNGTNINYVATGTRFEDTTSRPSNVNEFNIEYHSSSMNNVRGYITNANNLSLLFNGCNLFRYTSSTINVTGTFSADLKNTNIDAFTANVITSLNDVYVNYKNTNIINYNGLQIKAKQFFFNCDNSHLTNHISNSGLFNFISANIANSTLIDTQLVFAPASLTIPDSLITFFNVNCSNVNYSCNTAYIASDSRFADGTAIGTNNFRIMDNISLYNINNYMNIIPVTNSENSVDTYSFDHVLNISRIAKNNITINKLVWSPTIDTDSIMSVSNFFANCIINEFIYDSTECNLYNFGDTSFMFYNSRVNNPELYSNLTFPKAMFSTGMFMNANLDDMEINVFNFANSASYINMFQGAQGLKLNVTSLVWNGSIASTANNMFRNSINMDLSSLKTLRITGQMATPYTQNMFADSSCNLANLNNISVETMITVTCQNMFTNASGAFANNIVINTATVTGGGYYAYMFANANLPADCEINIIFNKADALHGEGMFAECSQLTGNSLNFFYDMSSSKFINTHDNDEVMFVDIEGCFRNCTSLSDWDEIADRLK
jgi:hypothetical protein